MQKQAPSIGRILIAVGFTLSCFALILFLWIAFGGPIPLKPKSYQITAYFPEATTLAVESDVRVGGVSVGKVKSLDVAPPEERVNGNDTTEATLEIAPEFAPISEDTKAILRQKTLLGETYVELTPGSESGEEAAPVALGAAANVSDAESQNTEPIEEGGTLGLSQTQDATQIDEIFNALDTETRESFQRWMANSAIAISPESERGLSLNDAFGNLGPFITDASSVFEILKRQKEELQGLVRDTGTVFEALTARDQQLAGLITGSNDTFEALASQDQALEDTFRILPTFERESRLTFRRLDEFQADTHPLINDLIPVARDLSPTLHSIRQLSPNLLSLFRKLDVLIDASDTGLPALERFLNGLAPVLDNLDPFLANLNPVIDYLEAQQGTVADFLAGPSVALSNKIACQPDPNDCGTYPAPRHYLRQLGYLSPEAIGAWPNRLDTNRGNGYLAPGALNGFQSASTGIWPNFECKNLDYHPGTQEGDPETQNEEIHTEDNPDPDANHEVDPSFAPCVTEGNFPGGNFGRDYGSGRFPTLFSDP